MNNVKIQPSLLYTVLCDDVRREDNGKFILIGLFETIGANSFPVNHATLYVMNCWAGGMGTFTQKTRIVSPDNSLLIEDKPTKISLATLRSKHRIVARFNNLQFKTAGEYAVEVLLDDELRIRYPLIVEETPPRKRR